MWLEIYPGKVENIALFSHLNRGKCWSCIRTILVLLWRYFKTSDSKFFAESSAKLFYCQTSTIPARYFGIYLGGILLQICCLFNAQLSLNEAKYCPLTIVNDVHMFFHYFVINGHFVSLCIVSLTISAPATLTFFQAAII